MTEANEKSQKSILYLSERETELPIPSQFYAPGDQIELTADTGITAVYGSTATGIPVIGEFLPSVNEGLRASLNASFTELSNGLSCWVVNKGCRDIPQTGALEVRRGLGSTGSIRVTIGCRIASDPSLSDNILTGILNGFGETTVLSYGSSYVVREYSFSKPFKVYVYPAIREMEILRKKLFYTKEHLARSEDTTWLGKIVSTFLVLPFVFVAVHSIAGLISVFSSNLAERFLDILRYGERRL